MPIELDKLQVMGPRVLVRPLPPEEQTEGGLVIPERTREEQAIGVVLQAGPVPVIAGGTTSYFTRLKAGDLVFWPKFQGTKLQTKDGVLVALGYELILAYIPQEKTT